MWRWAKRWADWVRNDLIPLARARRGGYTVHVRYETSGQTHTELPVPWTAEAVIVEVVFRLPPAGRRKADFALRFPDFTFITAESVRPETGDRHRVTFRFPVPRFSMQGEFLWKHRAVAQVTVPVLTADTFLGGLAAATPTLVARLGGQAIATRAFVAEGCKGLLASAVLRSPHRLSPAADLGVTVEFRHETTGRIFAVSVPLTTDQRSATEALVTAACPKVPRRPGWWSVTWLVGDRMLAASRIEVIAACRFEDAVRVAEARFAVAGKDSVVRMLRQAPAPGMSDRVGPCFLVASGEMGTAGLCRLAVFAVAPGHSNPTQLMEQEVLVTDAPTAFTPGLLLAEDLARIGGFELRLGGRVLGTASLSPVPPAMLTAEGGFKPPQEFPWTAAAEEELLDRLGRLGGS